MNMFAGLTGDNERYRITYVLPCTELVMLAQESRMPHERFELMPELPKCGPNGTWLNEQTR